jgi:UDP-glucuronate 4-epimerase
VRILVTGAAGFIGSHLVERLLDEGDEVIGIDGFIDSYDERQKRDNLSAFAGRDGFTFCELDLRAANLEPILEGLDAVVNEAAMPGLPRSWTDFDAYATNNLHAVQRLLAACVETGVRRFVQASTSSVYGRDAVGDERQPTRPISPYGVTKLAAEHLIMAYAEAQDLEPVILRYFSVYGPRQRPDMAYHIFSEALLDGRPITVFGDGRQTRSNTYVADCVRATVAASRGATPPGIYNIGGGEQIALLDAIAILGDSLGVEPRIEYRPSRPGDQRDTSADTTRAREAFGYTAIVGPRDGLAWQASWHVGRRL